MMYNYYQILPIRFFLLLLLIIISRQVTEAVNRCRLFVIWACTYVFVYVYSVVRVRETVFLHALSVISSMDVSVRTHTVKVCNIYDRE